MPVAALISHALLVEFDNLRLGQTGKTAGEGVTGFSGWIANRKGHKDLAEMLKQHGATEPPKPVAPPEAPVTE
jgi:hypothetical protein